MPNIYFTFEHRPNQQIQRYCRNLCNFPQNFFYNVAKKFITATRRPRIIIVIAMVLLIALLTFVGSFRFSNWLLRQQRPFSPPLKLSLVPRRSPGGNLQSLASYLKVSAIDATPGGNRSQLNLLTVSRSPATFRVAVDYPVVSIKLQINFEHLPEGFYGKRLVSRLPIRCSKYHTSLSDYQTWVSGMFTVPIDSGRQSCQNCSIVTSKSNGCFYRRPHSNDPTWRSSLKFFRPTTAMTRHPNHCSVRYSISVGAKANCDLSISIKKRIAKRSSFIDLLDRTAGAGGSYQVMFFIASHRKMQQSLPLSKQKQVHTCTFSQDCHVQLDKTRPCGLANATDSVINHKSVVVARNRWLRTGMLANSTPTCTGKLLPDGGTWLLPCDGGCFMNNHKQCDWNLAEWLETELEFTSFGGHKRQRQLCRIPPANSSRYCLRNTSLAFIGDSTIRAGLWGFAALGEGHMKDLSSDDELLLHDDELNAFYRMHYYNVNFTCPTKSHDISSKIYCSFDGALVSGLEWLQFQQQQNKSQHLVLVVGGAAWFNASVLTNLNYTINAYKIPNLKVLLRGHIASWFIEDQRHPYYYANDQIVKKQNENNELLAVATQLDYIPVSMWGLTVSRWKEFYGPVMCTCHHFREPSLSKPSAWNKLLSWYEHNGLLPAMMDVLSYSICQALR